MSVSYVIAAYSLDRCYGGPEECGWWYNSGELIRVIGVEKSEEKAYAKARRANRLLDRLYKGRGIYSMAYDGDQIGVEVHEDIAPPYYPTERPYYS